MSTVMLVSSPVIALITKVCIMCASSGVRLPKLEGHTPGQFAYLLHEDHFEIRASWDALIVL